ncbi:MAG: HDIG domain-containing protein, partial [Firmicutes bacterium]|nr:HDIG domain-containing protein [Bacillota bacterium]
MKTTFINPKEKKPNISDKLKTTICFLITFLAIVSAFIVKVTVIEMVRDNVLPLIVSVSLGYALILGTLFIYVYNTRRKIVYRAKLLAAICFAFGLTAVFAIFISHISVFLIPAALAAFIVSTFAEARDAFVVNILINVLIAFTVIIEILIGNCSELLLNIIWVMLFGILTGSWVSYYISKNARRISYIGKGLSVGIISAGLFIGVLLLQELLIYNTIVWGDLIMHSAFILGAVVGQVIIGFIVQPPIESIFNLITNARLVEFTDHHHPLIARLVKECPGTFNHSLNVANFAEICAVAIGENPYMARAAAYYHDIGKLVNPLYFRENQSDYNPHDELMPEVSAEIIRNHVKEGEKLCAKYRIPKELSDITAQHHGTLPIAVFYNKAKSFTDSEVDIKAYSYDESLPESKISAIIMLCDGGEAAVRSLDNPDGKAVDTIMRKLISERIDAGQFDNCDITLK